MAFKVWMSLITGILLALLVALAWKQIVHAWELLGQLNVWVLALLIPVQIISYLAAGEMMFSYLRSKGAMMGVGPLKQARMALELNFVNHVLPSGGVSGISYMNWRLKKYGITSGRATASQMIRYVAQFAAYIILLLISVAMITIDGNVNRWVILFSVLLVFMMTIGTVAMVFVISSQKRCDKFAVFVAATIRKVVTFVTFGRVKKVVDVTAVQKFLTEMHEEYLTLRHDRKLLLKPFLWGIVFNVFDTLLFVVTFWALGAPVSPAAVMIAYGLASFVGLFVVTPGGTGAYEAVMASFLVTAGMTPGAAIAGTLVTRIVVLLGTIGFGYIFYQLAILRHDK